MRIRQAIIIPRYPTPGSTKVDTRDDGLRHPDGGRLPTW